MAKVIAIGEAFDAALDALRAGQAVAIPTETVYGLAADAANGDAVLRIFEAKGRPRFNPLIAHVASLAMAREIAEFDELSLELAERFWPGPLTLVLPLKRPSAIHPLVTAGLDTIAVRMPRGMVRDLADALGRPLAAPSANTSGRVSATSAEAVERDLGDRIPLIVDGGPTPVGVESTIVRVEDSSLRLLRPGGVDAAAIESFAGGKLVREKPADVQAPGMLASHYAPGAAVRLNVGEVRPGEALLAFGSHRAAGAKSAVATVNLSETGDLREAARKLFASLQELDRTGARAIAVEPVPTEGLGEAINDRLARAAAPRDVPAGSA